MTLAQQISITKQEIQGIIDVLGNHVVTLEKAEAILQNGKPSRRAKAAKRDAQLYSDMLRNNITGSIRKPQIAKTRKP